MAMSSFDYPECYKSFIFYVTGHGADKWFYTEDGSVAYSEVVNRFHQQRNFKQRFFFFDCCRSHREGASHSQVSKPECTLRQDSRIMYATISGEQSWGKDGISSMTREMIKALPESETMEEVFRKVTNNISEQTLVYHSAAKEDPRFLREQKKKSKFTCRLSENHFIRSYVQL